jgi:GNAT superfamily N-acetyltransferase
MNLPAAWPEARKSTEMIFLTAADARRMEAAEEHGALYYARAMKPERPKWDSAWESFGGGHLVFVAKGAPVGRAHGLGFAGKVTVEDIQHVERFYFERKTSAQVDVCPYADPSLFEALNQRGFQVAEFNQTLARWISPTEPLGARVGGVEIRGIRKEEAQEWSTLPARVFFKDKWQQFMDFFRPWARPDNALTLAAIVNGRMVATASGLIIPECKLAAFFGAATLPEFQGRGIQSAFMQQRLKIAQQAGCDLALTLTLPGTTSQRNVERAGFRVAYTKVVVSKPWSSEFQ